MGEVAEALREAITMRGVAKVVEDMVAATVDDA